MASRKPKQGDELLHCVQLSGDYSEPAGGETLRKQVDDAIRRSIRDKDRFQGDYMVNCEIVDDKIVCEIADSWKTQRKMKGDAHKVDIKVLKAGSFGTFIVSAVVAD